MPYYTQKQKEYVDSVGEHKAHTRAINIIGELERELIQALHDNMKIMEEMNKLLEYNRFSTQLN